MLYQHDVGKLEREEILESFWQMNEQPAKVSAFANELFEGTLDRLKEIDKTIQQHTKHWRLSRMAAVDRNILRLAVYEFLAGTGTPATVVIRSRASSSRRRFAHPPPTSRWGLSTVR